MEFGLLGPMEVRHAGRTLTPGPAKHRVLLAALLLQPGQVVTAERLTDIIWADEPPATAGAILRVYVSALRRDLGAETIRTASGGYLIAVEPGQIDAHQFEDLLAAARQERDAGRAEEAAKHYRAALALWRGPALDGIESDRLRRADAVRLEELRLTALEERVEIDLSLGRHGELIGELRSIIAGNPLRERPWAQLMMALRKAGRRSEALDVFRQARRMLVDELGLEPGAELQAAHAAVLAEEKRPRKVVPRESPPDIADFTGRHEVLDWIKGSVVPNAPVHLVLHGPAGSGKTAVAIHAAAGMGGGDGAEFPDGVLYATAGNTVLEQFLMSLGNPVPTDPAERLRLYRSVMAQRRMLVVLDDATAESQVRPLLATGPGSLTLITSRSPLLGLEAARAYELGVLHPDAAVAMLSSVIGAGRVQAEPDAARRVAELCGGLPLALRIAGTRLARRADWPLEHLVRLLSDERRRLDELRAGDLAVRGSLTVGFNGLGPAEQRLFQRLGALSSPDFAPWLADLLGQVSPASLDDLVGSGLVQAGGIDGAGQERYVRHDLTRLYASSLAGDRAAVLREISSAVLSRVRRARAALLPAEPGSGLTRSITGTPVPSPTRPTRWLAAERRLLVSLVIDFHEAGLAEEAWRLAYYLMPFFEVFTDLADWHATAERGLAAARAAGHRHGEALMLRGLGDVHRLSGRPAEAEAALHEASRLEDDPRTLHRLALVHLDQERLPEAAGLLERALEAFAAAGDDRGRAESLRDLGVVRLRAGESGLDPLMEALRAYRDIGDPRGEATVLGELVEEHLAAKRPRDARTSAEACLRINHRIGDRLAEGTGLVLLARVAAAEGSFAAARTAAADALSIFEEFSDRRGTARALLTTADALLAMDDADGARQAAARARDLFERLGDARGTGAALRILNAPSIT